MATDWAADVKKYAPDADDGVIAGIVRYCGIALRKVDSSLVAFSDKKETDRVRENFLKKKLGLTQADKTLDAAIAKVGETMKADRTKNRVTVYYLLAANFKKLDLFAPKAKPAAKAPTKKSTGAAAGTAALAGGAGLSAAKAPAKQAPAKKPAAVATTKKTPAKKVAIKSPAAPQALVDKAAGAGSAAIAGTVAAAGAVAATAATAAASTVGAVKETTAAAVDAAGDAVGAVAGVAEAAVAGAAGLAASTADKAGAAVSQLTGTADDEDSGLGWLWWLLLALLAAFLIWWLFLRGPADEAAAPAPAATEEAAPAAAAEDLTAAPEEGSVEIPAGAGVTSELRDGKPVVKVYFDTAKTELAPAFAGAAGGLKAWLEANAGSSLAISGYSDPSGDAAANAELAKNRAQAVQAALVAAGIAETSALLVKPEQTSDATVPPEAARRVEVVVK
jgi:outer membrane protein OmpA-like peptidoglycan-associated protein